MPTFDARRVDPIRYDLTEFDRYDAKTGKWVDGKMCEGEGTVPEPTDKSLDAFMDAVDKINGDARRSENPITHAESRKLMTAAFVKHLRVPVEHLNELGPRQFNEFRDYVVLSLMNT